MAFLTDEEVVAFQRITLKTKGVNLTYDQAALQGQKLVQLFEAIGTCVRDPGQGIVNFGSAQIL